MADRYNHPDSVKARDVRLRGKKLVTSEPRIDVDPAKRASGAVTKAPKGQVKAGSYSKKIRKEYEDMLEEAGK